MVITINKDTVYRVLYYLYVAACLWFADFVSALLIAPALVLVVFMANRTPRGVCIVSKDRELALSIMGEVAERLEIKEVHVYEAKDDDNLEGLGIFADDSWYEMEDE